MKKSETSWRWLVNFKKISNIWLIFWRMVSTFLPDSFNRRWVNFWKDIGYGLPSSNFLIQRMLRYIQWNNLNTIVELWGWMGSMTRAIIAKKNDSTIFTTCEIQESRFHELKKYQNSHTNVLLMDAEACLSQFVPWTVQAIVSTLPLWSMSPMHAREILAAASKSLSNEGRFLQYQYFASNKEDIEKYFQIVDVAWEPLNFPPAFIYICKRR